jgi:hypothetical protein
MAESERPLWDAVKKHEDLRAMAADLGKRKMQLQTRLSQTSRKNPEREKIVREVQQVEAAILDVKQRAAAAGAARNHAEQALLKLRGSAAGVELTMPRVGPAMPLNEAQIHHLKLLAVRVRSEELRLEPRIRAALEFVAIVIPVLGSSR